MRAAALAASSLFAVVAAAASTAACDRERVVLFDEVDAGDVRDAAQGVDADAGADSGVDPDPQLSSLVIEPSEARVIAGEALPFRARGMFTDGERDVTALVVWSVEDPDLGAISAGLYQSAPDVGGTTAVLARLGDHEARAALTVFLDVEAIAGDAPPNAPSLFPIDPSGDETGASEPLIIYPSDGTMLPPNALGSTLQWRAPAEQQLFEVRIDSSVAKIRYYTTARIMAIEDRAHAWIARTHRGRTLSVVVRALSSSAIHRSSPITLEYAADDVRGTIYYWSTGAQGIMRAALDGTNAEKFYPEAGDTKCASCHTVSRNGRRIALGYDGEKLRVASIPERAVLYPTGAERPEYGWGTFDPEASSLLVANKGRLQLYALDAGTSRSIPLPNGVFVSHPDWSPDGRQIAVVVTDGEPKNKEVKGSSLARIPVGSDGTFGAIEILVPSVDDEDTMAFPSHSPDGAWIAFVRTHGDSKDSKEAELSLIRADGTAPPFLLERLNRTVRNESGVLDIGNSMPTWAPSARSGLGWIAFSSLRDYGDVLVGADRDQLWAAAIDLDRASGGVDASFPAFWLPFQSYDDGNHRAFWSSNPEDDCPATAELCDGRDNDCDSMIDEDCCTPADELCGNDRDDDCDGAVDEGCGCMTLEVCMNMIDDDCDGLTDLADEDCAL